LGSENVKLKSNNNNNTNEDGESEILFYEDDPVSICEKLGKFFKNIFRIVVPGSNVSKFKKVLRSTKSLWLFMFLLFYQPYVMKNILTENKQKKFL